jgi:hypothetical protein
VSKIIVPPEQDRDRLTKVITGDALARLRHMVQERPANIWRL